MYVKDGRLVNKGDKIRNPALAVTLQKIADAGNADPFYTGNMAEKFVKEVSSNRGKITLTDLRSYTAVLRDPLDSKIGDYTILNAPPPASGPVLAFILNVLKGNILLVIPALFTFALVENLIR